MSRQVLARYTITATLTAAGPIHIGGAHQGLATDMLCAVNGAGDFYLPGPSLAGALRGELQARDVQEAVLWGDDTTESASRVRVADAPATTSPVVEIRDGVTIQARTGTAEPGKLYTREVLPAGTSFAARIEIEELPKEPAQRLAQNLAQLLAIDGITVGAFKTKGLGHLRACDVRLTRTDLATPTGLLNLLFGEPDELPFDAVALPARGAQVTIRIDWRARGPVLVSRATDGGGVDTVPLTAGGPQGERLCLPGSSIKGALRSQAERIVATMAAGAVAKAEVTAVGDLFGAAGERSVQDGTARNTGWRGALRVADVHCLAALPPHSAIGFAEPVDGPALAVGDHVAIDRWTGGALDSALYSVLEPWQTQSGQWEPINLVVELQRIPAERRDAALGLLYLVCRDLCDGWFGIGYGTARGYGAIEAEPPQFAGLPDLPDNRAIDAQGQPARAWVAALWEGIA